MSRRALLTGTFRDADSGGDESPPTADERAPRRRRQGEPLSREQREELDNVLEQMNGPTGFEDLEVRES